jgi:TolB protein
MRRGLATVIVGALTVTVAACGGSGSSGDGASSAAASAGTPTATTSPGGAPEQSRSIVFRRFLKPDHTHGAIFTIAPDGTGERQITTPDAAFGDDYPDFSADGSTIAFQRCTEAAAEDCRVFTVRPDGTGLRTVGLCHGHEVPPRCADASYPAMAPNGRRIAFVRASGRILEDQFQHQGISTMRSDGSGVRRVTEPRSRTAIDEEPQWSSDGRRIVFVRANLTAKPVGRKAIFVVRPDGGGLHRVTPWSLDAGDGPVWSPDDSRILFQSPANDDFLNSNLYTIHPDGTHLEQITHVAPTTSLYSSSFSLDGSSIAFGMAGVAGAADVYTMHADGTGVKPVTRTPLQDSAPDWGTTG